MKPKSKWRKIERFSPLAFLVTYQAAPIKVTKLKKKADLPTTNQGGLRSFSTFKKGEVF